MKSFLRPSLRVNILAVVGAARPRREITGIMPYRRLAAARHHRQSRGHENGVPARAMKLELLALNGRPICAVRREVIKARPAAIIRARASRA